MHLIEREREKAKEDWDYNKDNLIGRVPPSTPKKKKMEHAP